MSVEEEKREAVIHAALQEFLKGFVAANTDVIVSEAGISKGLLFHYFGSKRGLFLFLLKYALFVVLPEYDKAISKSLDLLENMRAVTRIGRELIARYPLIYAFMAKAQSSLEAVFPEGLKGENQSSTHRLAEYICQSSSNDDSLLKDGIDGAKARNIIVWTMNGLSESLRRYGDDIENYRAHFVEIAEEQEEYLQLLHKILYR